MTLKAQAHRRSGKLGCDFTHSICFCHSAKRNAVGRTTAMRRPQRGIGSAFERPFWTGPYWARSSMPTTSASAKARRVATEPCFRPVSISATVTRLTPVFFSQCGLDQAAQIAVDAQRSFAAQQPVRIIRAYCRVDGRGRAWTRLGQIYSQPIISGSLIQRSNDRPVVSVISKRTGLRVLLCVTESRSLTQPAA